MLRGNESNTKHALPDDGKRAERRTNMRRRFKCDPKWITVRYPAKCAEPNCQTEIKSGERAFYYPGDKALYGALVAVTARRPNATSTPTGSTKRDSKSNSERNWR
jgi:hypothetical protein